MEIKERLIKDYGKVKRAEYIENHTGDGYSIDEPPVVFENCDVKLVKRTLGRLWTMEAVYINGKLMKALVMSIKIDKNGTLRIVACVGN